MRKVPAYVQASMFALNHQSHHPQGLAHEYTNQGGITLSLWIMCRGCGQREDIWFNSLSDWESMADLLTHGRGFLRG